MKYTTFLARRAANTASSRKWRLHQRRLGLCTLCKDPAIPWKRDPTKLSAFCTKHKQTTRLSRRKDYATNAAIFYAERIAQWPQHPKRCQICRQPIPLDLFTKRPKLRVHPSCQYKKHLRAMRLHGRRINKTRRRLHQRAKHRRQLHPLPPTFFRFIEASIQARSRQGHSRFWTQLLGLWHARTLSGKTGPHVATVLLFRSLGLTLQDIGVLFGLTTERIRQMEAIGTTRLQHPATLLRGQSIGASS